MQRLARIHPVQILLDNPATYLLFSVLAVLFYVSLTALPSSPFFLAQGLHENHLSCTLLLNASVACFYAFYSLACVVCFHERPSLTEHILIGRNLSRYVPWEILVLITIVDPTTSDFNVWLVWYLSLVASKVRN